MKKLSGFSIIELVAVVTITAIVSLVSVAVLVNSQIRSTRSTLIAKVRREGDFLIREISFLLRNARYVAPNQFSQTCEQDMTAISVVNRDGGLIELYLDDDFRVASNSGTVLTDPPSSFLSSPDVRIGSLEFDCEQSPSERGAYVTVTTKVESGVQDTLSPEAYYSQDFTTNVYIRSYQ